MRDAILTGLFALVTLGVATAGDRVFSLISGLEPGQAFIAALSWIGIVLGFHKYIATRDTDRESTTNDHSADTDENDGNDEEEETDSADTADRQPDVEPQSQARSFSDTTDTDTDPMEVDVEPAETGSQSSLRRSNDTIISDAERQLNGRLTFYDDGTIDTQGHDLTLYKEMLLYVVGKRLAYEDGAVDTPVVTVDELRDRFKYNTIETLLFLDEAQNWLVPANDHITTVADIDYTDLDTAAVTVKTRTVDDAAEWVLDPTMPDDFGLLANTGTAVMALHYAREHYESGKDYEER